MSETNLLTERLSEPERTPNLAILATPNAARDDVIEPKHPKTDIREKTVESITDTLSPASERSFWRKRRRAADAIRLCRTIVSAALASGTYLALSGFTL